MKSKKPKLFSGQMVKFNVKAQNTGEALDVWMRSPCCDAPPCAQFKGSYTCAQCKKAYTRQMSILMYHREDFKGGKVTPVPQMSLFKTAELIDELKRRGLGVFSLDMPFQYIPKQREVVMTYRLKAGKKLQFINVLYGRVPEHFTDLTKLTFMKADFDPAHLKGNEGYFKCIQFEWVFIAALDEFIPFCTRHK